MQIISEAIERLRASCPCDFNRPPRTLLELPYWAGTEYRRSLLYEGVVVYRDTLNVNVYKHFLLLHSAMYILCSPVHYLAKSELADQLLRVFISHSIEIYGAKFVVYNVHCLCHLAAECALQGTADSIISFCFENKLGAIKESLMSGYKPLIQAANRDLERMVTEVNLEGNVNEVTLARPHHVDGEIIEGLHYKYLRVNDVEFKLNRKDSCFKTKHGEVVVLANIVRSEHDGIHLVGYSFQNSGNLYEYPFPSSEIGIVSVSDLAEDRRAYALHEIESKCWLMPDGDQYACFPLVHSSTSLL